MYQQNQSDQNNKGTHTQTKGWGVLSQPVCFLAVNRCCLIINYVCLSLSSNKSVYVVAVISLCVVCFCAWELAALKREAVCVCVWQQIDFVFSSYTSCWELPLSPSRGEWVHDNVGEGGGGGACRGFLCFFFFSGGGGLISGTPPPVICSGYREVPSGCTRCSEAPLTLSLYVGLSPLARCLPPPFL